MCLTSEIQTPITPLFINENIKCGYSFSLLERKEQCGSKIICVFKSFWFLHFHRLPCELENARVLYKIKRKESVTVFRVLCLVFKRPEQCLKGPGDGIS